MKWARYAIPSLLAAVVAGWVLVDYPGVPERFRYYLDRKRWQAAYRRDMRQLLSGQLIAAEFEPGMGKATIRTQDPAALKQVKSWLISREPETINPAYALKQPFCQLVLVFDDGHREKMGFDLASRPRSGRGCAMVWWNGYRLSGSDQPFTTLARSQRP